MKTNSTIKRNVIAITVILGFIIMISCKNNKKEGKQTTTS